MTTIKLPLQKSFTLLCLKRSTRAKYSGSIIYKQSFGPPELVSFISNDGNECIQHLIRSLGIFLDSLALFLIMTYIHT